MSNLKINLSSALRLLLLVFVFSSPSVSIAAPSDETSQVYAKNNGEKENWFFSKLGKLFDKAGDKLLNAFEEAVNDFFEGNVWEKFAEGLVSKFGDTIFDNFSNFFSFGPFFSFDSLFSSQNEGPSEIQIMTQILLDAIDDSKEEILNAIEEHYQTETEVLLNTIIRELAVHNARSYGQRAARFSELRPWITFANTVKERIEIKQESVFDNLHLYMKVAALQIQMELEYTRFSYLDTNPEATEEEILAETERVMTAQLGQDLAFITGNQIGSLAAWEQSFDNSLRHAQETLVFHEHESPEVCRPHIGSDPYFAPDEGFYSTPDMCQYWHINVPERGYYSYRMNDTEVNFFVGFDSGPDRYNMCSRYAYIFDVSGKYLGREAMVIDCHGNDAIGALQNSDLVAEAIDNHRSDREAFKAYLRDGYLPVKKMIDKWWELTGLQSRTKSEVDAFVENNLENKADLLVSLKPHGDSKAKKFGDDLKISYWIEVSNLGKVDAYNVRAETFGPKIVRNHGTDVKKSRLFNFFGDLEDGIGSECYIENTRFMCDFGTIEAGTRKRALVSVITNKNFKRDFTAKVTSSSRILNVATLIETRQFGGGLGGCLIIFGLLMCTLKKYRIGNVTFNSL